MTVEEMRDRWDRVLDLSRRGVPIEQIAEQLGISVTHVSRIRARQRKSKQSRRSFTAEEIVIIEEMLNDGCSYAEVARTINRAPKSIRRRWPGRGWDKTACAEFGALRYKALQQLPGI
jgi:DNA-binding NarL/FixJ family response regulator